jgi:post-segregation antitoxin (ccd killing protein)
MGSDMPIVISVSAGELVDKITILEIIAEQFTDAEKLRNVRHELDLLTAARDQAIRPSAELGEVTRELKSVNAELWQIEDAIRRCEHAKDFGLQFIELARAVYHANDRRFELKRRVNELVGSDLVEEKSYAPYQ